jgi:hypothetical protein
MPIYFKDLVYDYYLVQCSIILLFISSVIGIISSYSGNKNVVAIELITCIGSSIGLLVWSILMARIGVATVNGWSMGMLYIVIIVVLIATASQVMALTNYVQFAYKTTLYRVL